MCETFVSDLAMISEKCLKVIKVNLCVIFCLVWVLHYCYLTHIGPIGCTLVHNFVTGFLLTYVIRDNM